MNHEAFVPDDVVEVGNVYLLKNKSLLVVDYRNGPIVGGVLSEGSRTAWSHYPSFVRFLTYMKARLVAQRPDINEHMDIADVLLLAAEAIAVASV